MDSDMEVVSLNPKVYSTFHDTILVNNDQDKSHQYIPALDGFRAIAILLVVVSHLGFGDYVPGGFGVTLFFFLSGFLITRLLISEFEQKKTVNLKGFYIRRLIRLYPPLVLMGVVFSIVIILAGKEINFLETLAAAFYWENYYIGLASYKELFYIPLWSLAVEEHFYLVFPLVFFLCYRFKRFDVVLVMLICCPLLFRIYYVSVFPKDVAFTFNYNFTHCRFDSILFGCLASVLLNGRSILYNYILSKKAFFIAAVILVFLTLLYRDDNFRNTFRYTFQGIALMVIVPAILLKKDFKTFKSILSKDPIIFIGKISYSIYVMHWICIFIGDHLFLSNKNPYDIYPIQWYLVVITGTIILSLFSYFIIEKKFIALRRRFGSLVN